MPITSQAPTQPTLTPIAVSTFTYGIATTITVSFNETLQSFAPSINGTGATITTTWVAGQSSAQCSVTAAADSTALTFAVVDNNDGGADTMTHGITVVAPAQPVLNSLSVSGFTTFQEATGVVATFDRDVQSISGITLANGTATITSSFPSRTVTFKLTANAAANPGSLLFNGVVSTEGSDPVSRSWNITVTDPAVPAPKLLLDASSEASFDVNGSGLITSIRNGAGDTSAVISIAGTLGALYRGPAYIQNGLNYIHSANGDGSVTMAMPVATTNFTFSFTGRYKSVVNNKYCMGVKVGGRSYSHLIEGHTLYDNQGPPWPMSAKTMVAGNTYTIDFVRDAAVMTIYLDGDYWGQATNLSGNLTEVSIGPGFGVRFDVFSAMVHDEALASSVRGILRGQERTKWGV